MKKAAITACSNALQPQYRSQIGELSAFLRSIGIETELSGCIYSEGVFSGTPRERAEELMRMFRDPEIEEIYDVSGGDVANQVLDELDYEAIAASKATFWGYSDLTTVINAIYTMTGKESVLYQVRNLVRGNWAALQRERFRDREVLLRPAFTFVQGSAMEGVVVGGNVRCFLKLAGTRYFPDLQGKILLLEALGGGVAQNMRLRGMIEDMAKERGARMFVPDRRFCMDNGAMIAWLGNIMYESGVRMRLEDTAVEQRFRTDEVDVTWRR